MIVSFASLRVGAWILSGRVIAGFLEKVQPQCSAICWVGMRSICVAIVVCSVCEIMKYRVTGETMK